jgi:hypothetical protein
MGQGCTLQESDEPQPGSWTNLDRVTLLERETHRQQGHAQLNVG